MTVGLDKEVTVPADYPHGGYGNVSEGNGNGTKLVWWIMGVVGSVIAASVMFMASAMYGLQGRVGGIEAKVDILLMDRRK